MDLTCILLFGFTFLLIYWFLTKNYNYWEKQNVPYVQNPIPGFGNLLPVITLRESMYDFTERIFKSTKKSMIGFYFMRRPALLVRDPELVKSVLQTNFSNFRRNLISLSEKQDPVFARHPFFTRDLNVWKDRRIHISNNLSGKKLQHLFVIARDVCSKMTEYLDRKIDEHAGLYDCGLKTLFVRYTGEVVANSGFGIEGQSFNDNPDRMSFAKVAGDFFKPTFVNGIKQTLVFYVPDFVDLFRIKFMPDHADRYFRENVKSMIIQRKQMSETPNDFLQFCIDNVGESDMNTLVADLVSFFGDTYETSSSVLAHLFYLLSLHPEIQDKLRQHIITKLNGKPVSYESLKEMNYIDQVLNESMRLIPPLSALMKVCNEEITLSAPDGLKCHLKPGFPVFIPLGIHLDEKYWPNPNIFDPERFSPENQETNTKFAFVPFGEGPRMCIGMRLGVMLIKLAIITVLTKYSFEVSKKTKVPLEMDPNAIVTNFKGGVWAKIKKLEKCN